MRTRTLLARLGVLVFFLLAVAPLSARAAVSFVGHVGAASDGAVGVGWATNGVPDSTLNDFGMPTGVVASQIFTSGATHELPGFSAYVFAHASLSLAAAGPCGRDAPVATATVGIGDLTMDTPPAHFARAQLDLRLRYTADQPIVYWAILRYDGTDLLYPGPEGEVVHELPVYEATGLVSSGWEHGVGFAGSVPNTGEFDLGAFLRLVRADEEPANWTYSENTRVFLSATSLVDMVTGVEGTATPARIALAAPRPNPARGGTSLVVELPAPAHVTLEIVDVAGRHVRTLLDGDTPAGVASVRWNGDDARGARAGAGVYFARLVAGGETRVRKIALL